jgi:tetratricopeptide (TPR) repeat protein
MLLVNPDSPLYNKIIFLIYQNMKVFENENLLLHYISFLGIKEKVKLRSIKSSHILNLLLRSCTADNTIDPRGIGLYEEGKYEDATQIFYKNHLLDTADVSQLYYLGLCCDKQNQPIYALKSFLQVEVLDCDYKDNKECIRQCREKFKEHINELSGIVNMFLRSQKYEEALEAIDTICLIQPDDGMSFYLKGNVLSILHRYEDAEVTFKKTAELDPKMTHVYYMIIRNRMMRLREDAFDFYDLALSVSPEAIDTLDNMQLFAIKHKRYALALKCNDKLIILNPGDNSKHYCERGKLLNELDNPEEALIWLDKSIELKPNQEAFEEKAFALSKLNRNKEENLVIDELIKINPKNSIFYNIKASALGKLQRFKEAVDFMNKAIRLDSENSVFYLNKGLLLKKDMRFKEAIECFDIMISKRLGIIAAIMSKASCLDILGRKEEAIDYYRKLSKLVPDDLEVMVRLKTLEELRH